LARAEDLDEISSNSTIIYELTVNPRDLFSIVPSTGMISLKKPLMRGKLQYNLGSATSISLEVRAIDQSLPLLSSRQLVTLLVDDVNDHTPVFK
jgi:protocadherin Fat 4